MLVTVSSESVLNISDCSVRYVIRERFRISEVIFVASHVKMEDFGLADSLKFWMTMERVPLTTACQVVLGKSVATGVKCNCRAGCDTNRCACRRENVKCGQHCHRTHKCKNVPCI